MAEGPGRLLEHTPVRAARHTGERVGTADELILVEFDLSLVLALVLHSEGHLAVLHTGPTRRHACDLVAMWVQVRATKVRTNDEQVTMVHAVGTRRRGLGLHLLAVLALLGRHLLLRFAFALRLLGLGHLLLRFAFALCLLGLGHLLLRFALCLLGLGLSRLLHRARGGGLLGGLPFALLREESGNSSHFSFGVFRYIQNTKKTAWTSRFRVGNPPKGKWN